MTKPNFFAAGVDDHLGRWVDHDVPKTVERSRTQRIDEIERLFGRNLNEAKARVIAVLSDELRIQAEPADGCKMGTAGLEVLGMSDDLFFDVRHTSLCQWCVEIAH